MKPNEEELLRSQIRRTIKIWKSAQVNFLAENIKSENRLREILRSIILEAAVEDPESDPHENTGINTLKDMIKNTNILKTLKLAYKTLTTTSDQRESFRSHIVQWVTYSLLPIKANDAAPLKIDMTPPVEIAEQNDIDIDVVDDDKFIDADDGDGLTNEPEVEAEEEENPMAEIPGKDTTGRNRAERVYPQIEKSVIDYYSILDNEEDQEMFYDYLIANIKLYFDKWEKELAATAIEPTNDEYEQAKIAPGIESEPPPIGGGMAAAAE